MLRLPLSQSKTTRYPLLIAGGFCKDSQNMSDEMSDEIFTPATRPLTRDAGNENRLKITENQIKCKKDGLKISSRPSQTVDEKRSRRSKSCGESAFLYG